MSKLILSYSKSLLAIISIIVLSSCASRKEIVYLQTPQSNSENLISYEPRLQADDLLSITVNSKNPLAVTEFNLPILSMQGVGENIVGQQRLQSYLIDAKGNILFPTIGEIKLAGLTRIQAIEKITELLKPYVVDAVVNMRILNFKVSVQGEVNRPAVHNVTTERITLLEALSLSGDLTIYGKRDNILVVREIDGKKTYNYVDITKTDFVNSEFYYLAQNDLIYVEPNKTKVNSSVVGPNVTAIISGLSVLASVISVIAVISR